MAARDGKGRFVKGKSGNPRGRPIGSRNRVMTNDEFERAIKERDSEALDTLIRIMRDTKATNNERMKAAFKILDESIKIRATENELDIQRTGKGGSTKMSVKRDGTTNQSVVSITDYISTEYDE